MGPSVSSPPVLELQANATVSAFSTELMSPMPVQQALYPLSQLPRPLEWDGSSKKVAPVPEGSGAQEV